SSATHQDLAQCVEQGKFRQDLYYRLNVIELRLPPLRERPQDIPLLAQAILKRLAGGEEQAQLSEAALQALQAHTFPGNVRELENILERALAFANDGVIEVSDLALRQAQVSTSLQTAAPAEVEVAPAAIAETAIAGTASVAAVPPAGSDSHREAPAPDLPASLPDHLESIEREVILRALAKTHFNRTQAAELLGISFRQLRYR